MNPFRRKKLKSFVLRPIRVIVAPFVLLLMMSVWWWVNSEWMLYSKFILFPQDGHNQTKESEDISSNTEDGKDSSSESSNGNDLSGIDLGLMNSIGGDYCGDWLVIARDHANGSKMNSDVAWPQNKKVDITYVIGTALKECDPQSVSINGNKVRVPHSTINIRDYEYGTKVGDSKMDLYTVNTEWLNKFGSQYRDTFFTEDMKKGSYWTTFQMSRDHLSKSPNNPNGTGGVRYASLLNGYNIAPGTNRGKEGGDFGFFPDWVSATIQSGWSRLQENANTIGTNSFKLDAKVANGIGYAMTNAGQGNFVSWIGLGHPNIYSGDRNYTTSTARSNIPKLNGDHATVNAYTSACTSDAINQILTEGDKCYDYLFTHSSLMQDGDYLDRTFWEGISAGAVAFGCKDSFINSANAPRFKAHLSVQAYCRGLNFAYAAIKGGSPADNKGVETLQKMANNPKDPAGYNLFNFKKAGANNSTVYFYDASGNTVDGSRPVIHAAVQEPVSGLFGIPIAGTYMYWKMLQYAGVDCTLDEVVGSSGGDLIEEIPAGSNNENSTQFKSTEFWRGLTLLDNRGNIITENINELERALTLEAIGFQPESLPYEWKGKKGVSAQLYNDVMKNNKLCKWHQCDKYNTAVGSMNNVQVNPAGTHKNNLQYAQCTWWAWGRAAEYLDSIKSDKLSAFLSGRWGNGGQYYDFAKTHGFSTTQQPETPCIVSWGVVQNGSVSGYGHVGFVEVVDSSGNYWTSEAGSGVRWYGITMQPAGTTKRVGWSWKYSVRGFIPLK